MPVFGGMGCGFAAEDEESMRRKLRQLTSDPLASVRNDPEFLAFKSDQFRRVYPGAQEYDATGRAIDPTPLVTAIEPFRPKVKRDDLAFSAPVGEDAANKYADLLGAKRALSNTGLFDFDVTRERSDQAGPAFTDAVKAFQRNRGLKVDGLMNPEGPTIKSLRDVLFPHDSAGNVGKPVNLASAAMPVKERRSLTEIEPEMSVPSTESKSTTLDENGPKDRLLADAQTKNTADTSYLPYQEAPLELRGKPATKLSDGSRAPVLNNPRDREQAILNNKPAVFEIKDNPHADGSVPIHAVHSAGAIQVDVHSQLIEEEARRQGVDPDLMRAIMYVENAQGNIFGIGRFLDSIELSKTILPMNINPMTWQGLGFVAEDLNDPRKNIAVRQYC